MTRIVVVVLAVAAALSAPDAACAADAATIVEKVIEAYGGKERLAAVRSISAEGRITAFLRGDEGTYRRTLRRDGSLVVDIVYGRSSERRVLRKGKGYRGTAGRLEEVSGPQLQAMVHQYDELDLPYGFLDGSLAISSVWEERVNGEAIHALRLVDRGGNRLEVFVDRKDHHIVKSEGTFSVGTESTTLAAEFGDFRTVDDVLLPFRIVNYAGGRKISVTIIDRYVINPPVDDAVFRP